MVKAKRFGLYLLVILLFELDLVSRQTRKSKRTGKCHVRLVSKEKTLLCTR